MSGRINYSNLSDSLKEHLNGLGLTEEQVNELIENALVEINEKNVEQDEVVNGLVDKVGELNGLMTEEKGDLVGAINELFQSANNGKELIASAIGEPLNSEDTFSAMSTDINGLLSTFKTNMMNNGVTVNSSDRFKSLIDKIATLADSEGKGIQFASGNISSSNITITRKGQYKVTYPELEFIPNILFITGYEISDGAFVTNCILSNLQATYLDNEFFSLIIDNITNNSCYIVVDTTQTVFLTVTDNDLKYYAIGVGEEDTTLRDSLASILEEEGVGVTEEDDMASLIAKVDQEFDRQVKPAGNVTSDKVVEGNTFMNSSGELLTGTMVNHPVNTNFMSVNAYNDGKLYVRIPFGAYLTPGSAGYPIIVIEDKNFISDNIIEGVTIMGVTGTGANGYSIVPGTNITFASNNEWESMQQSTTDNQIIYSEKQINVVYNGSYTLSATMDFTFNSSFSSGSGEYGVTIFDSNGTINRSVCVETFTNSLSTGFTNTVKNINIENIELLEGQYVKTYATSSTASTNGISIQTDSMSISGNLE